MLLDKLRNKQKQRREKGCIPAGRTLLSFDSYQELGTRKNQEDCLLCLGDTEGNKGFLGIVADGMGGMENGAEAANMERLLPAWWQTAEPWHMRTWSRKRRATGS